MKSNFLFKYLFSLGLHIGSYTHTVRTENYQFLLGTRGEHSIFNMQLTVSQINRSIIFLRELGKLSAFLLFSHSSINHFPLYLQLLLINYITLRNRHAYTDQHWSYGQLSNSSTQIDYLFNFLFYFDIQSKNVKRTPNYFFFDLLHRILFFTIDRRLEGVSWLDTFTSVKKYWRFLIFFKHYSFTRNSPDALVYFNNNSLYIPQIEAETSYVPLVLVSNSSIVPHGASYLITTNNFSYITTLFYIVLFMNSYNYGFSSFFSRIPTNSRVFKFKEKNAK